MSIKIKLEPFSEDLFSMHFDLTCMIDFQPTSIHLDFTCKGDTQSILTPPPAQSPQFKDGLWNETCFEFFLGDPFTGKYWEWNFAPSGNWAAYSFESYRKGQANCSYAEPSLLSFQKLPGNLHLKARIPNVLKRSTQLNYSPTVILKDNRESVTHWAGLHHKDKPDFHDFSTFLIWERSL